MRASRNVSQRGTTDAHEGGLDDRARAILDFEREAWKLDVPKERAIRERFGFSAARYHQLLHRIVDGPHALEYDPMLVRPPHSRSPRIPSLGRVGTQPAERLRERPNR
jgi:Protein of unknown function (DUF3263)